MTKKTLCSSIDFHDVRDTPVDRSVSPPKPRPSLRRSPCQRAERTLRHRRSPSGSRANDEAKRSRTASLTLDALGAKQFLRHREHIKRRHTRHHNQCIITFWNEAAELLYGYRPRKC